MTAEQPVTATSQSEQVGKVGWFAVLLILGISAYAAFAQRPAIATDVGTYLLANATSHDIKPTVLTSVDPQDLSQDRRSPITWWPESYLSLIHI